MKNTVTNDERLQLLGLLTLARQHQAVVRQAEQGMAGILRIPIDDAALDLGHLSDAIYEIDPLDIDTLLSKMKIEVTK